MIMTMRSLSGACMEAGFVLQLADGGGSAPEQRRPLLQEPWRPPQLSMLTTAAAQARDLRRPVEHSPRVSTSDPSDLVAHAIDHFRGDRSSARTSQHELLAHGFVSARLCRGYGNVPRATASIPSRTEGMCACRSVTLSLLLRCPSSWTARFVDRGEFGGTLRHDADCAVA